MFRGTFEVRRVTVLARSFFTERLKMRIRKGATGLTVIARANSATLVFTSAS